MEFSDWRDCREQANTLNTQLAKIIERLHRGRSGAPAIGSESIVYLVEFMFSLLGQRRSVFVFDNTDQYVDIEYGRFVGGLETLLDRATRTDHNAKFIFTCRPRVELVADGCIHIELGGLSESDAVELFELRGVSEASSDPATRARIARLRALTTGHPLWMNLIATQVSQASSRFDILLDRVEREQDLSLPSGFLREIWKGLSAKQQKVLRYMAEMIHPEPETRIAQFIEHDLRYNQLHKAIRTLKGLDLVVVKMSSAEEALELHPLVRQFIRQEFPREERTRYINPIIRVIDAILKQVKSAAGVDLSAQQVRYPTSKIELWLNAGDYKGAATLLLETKQSLLRLGYPEEFVRLAEPIIANTRWSVEGGEQQKLYDRLMHPLIDTLSDLGRFGQADRHLDDFEASITGKTARYINLCDVRCYSYWSRRDFDLAIEWGRRGQELKAAGGLDTEHDCAHNLALSQRDGGHVQQALEYFLGGVDLSDVVAGNVPEGKASGSFWGNIARCLYLQGRYAFATICLLRSASALEADAAGSDVHHVNRGWAAMWLGETYEANGDREQGVMCYTIARERWRNSSPPKARIADEALKRLLKNGDAAPPDWKAERAYTNLLMAAAQAHA